MIACKSKQKSQISQGKLGKVKEGLYYSLVCCFRLKLWR